MLLLAEIETVCVFPVHCRLYIAEEQVGGKNLLLFVLIWLCVLQDAHGHGWIRVSVCWCDCGVSLGVSRVIVAHRFRVTV